MAETNVSGFSADLAQIPNVIYSASKEKIWKLPVIERINPSTLWVWAQVFTLPKMWQDN